MSNYKGTEMWGRLPRRIKLVSRLATLGMFCGALLCVAAVDRLTVNVLGWRTDDESARLIVPSDDYSERDRRNAIVTLVKNASASIAVLKEAAKRQDYVGAHARNALVAIEESLR